MKHKKICLGFALLLSLVTLSGCTDVKNLSDEESDMIAEFSAGVLLRYSEDYPYRLITDKQHSVEAEVTATPTPVETPVPTEAPTEVPTVASNGAIDSSDETTEKKEASVSVNEIYQIEGLEFSYKSYQFCKSYGKGAGLIMAEDGQRLLVVSFGVRNTTGQTKKVNLMNRKIEYTLNLNGSEYLPGISMLKNGGLNYLKTIIQKGKTEEAVLIYSVSEEQTKVSSITLEIKAGEKVSDIQLK